MNGVSYILMAYLLSTGPTSVKIEGVYTSRAVCEATGHSKHNGDKQKYWYCIARKVTKVDVGAPLPIDEGNVPHIKIERI